MESAWALACTKYLVGGFDKIFEDNLSSIYSVMDLATSFSFWSNGDQFAMKLGCVGNISNNQKPSLW